MLWRGIVGRLGFGLECLTFILVFVLLIRKWSSLRVSFKEY